MIMKSQAYEHFLNTTIKISPPDYKQLFFIERKMPCCLEPKQFFQISRIGHFYIISCFHCGFKWHINKRKQFIEPFKAKNAG